MVTWCLSYGNLPGGNWGLLWRRTVRQMAPCPPPAKSPRRLMLSKCFRYVPCLVVMGWMSSGSNKVKLWLCSNQKHLPPLYIYHIQHICGQQVKHNQRKFRSSNFRLYWKLLVGLAASMLDSRNVLQRRCETWEILAGRNCAKRCVFP